MIATGMKINPQMITLARESRGLLQKELADLLGISTGKICRVEQGDQPLSDATFYNLCKILKYPAEFFSQPGEAYLTSSLNFRKRVNVAQKLLMPIEAKIGIYRLNIETLTNKIKFPEPAIPFVSMQENDTPEDAARKLRKYWKVPAGPIENMTDLLEAHNIMVVNFDFGTERVDSRVILTKNMQPVIIINKSMLGDRQRFSLAFELGQLVMHSLTIASMNRDIDHEANLFAAEFLMPEKDIRKDFEKITINLPTLSELKLKWKVSMQALLYRAADLGFLTLNQKNYIIGLFNSLNIRRREPIEFDVPKETPKLLRDLITKYRTAQRMSVKEMAAVFYLEQEEFLERYT